MNRAPLTAHTDQPTLRRKPKVLRAFIYLLIILLLLPVILALCLHMPLIRNALVSYGIKQASAAMHTEIAVESLSLNVFTGTVRINGISMRSFSAPDQSRFEVGSITLDLAMHELITGKISVRELSIEKPGANLFINEQGELVLPFQMEASDKPTPVATPEVQSKFQPPPVVVTAAKITNGWFHLDNKQAESLQLRVQGLNLKTNLDLSTLQSKGELSLDSLRVAMKSTVESANPLKVNWELPGGERGAVTLKLALGDLAFDSKIEVSNLLSDLAYTSTSTLEGSVNSLIGLLGLEQAVSADLHATITASGGLKGIPDVQLALEGKELSYGGWRVDTCNLMSELANGRLEKSNLKLETAGGSIQIEASGAVYPELEQLEAKLQFNDLQSMQLLAPLQLSVPVTGVLSGDLQVTAEKLVPEKMQITAHITSESPKTPVPAGYLAPSLNISGTLADNTVNLTEIVMSDTSLLLKASGTFDLATQDYTGSLQLVSADISRYARLAKIEGSGSISLDLTGAGSLKNPGATGNLALKNLVFGETKIDAVNAQVSIREKTFELRTTQLEAMDLSAQVEAHGELPLDGFEPPKTMHLTVGNMLFQKKSLPSITIEANLGIAKTIRISADKNQLKGIVTIPPEGLIKGDIELSKFDLGIAAPFLPAQLKDFSGVLSGTAKVAIPLSEGAPDVNANFSEFRIEAAGKRLENSEALAVSMKNNTIQVDSFKLAASDKSDFSVQGTIDISKSKLDLKVATHVPDLATWRALTGQENLKGAIDIDMNIQGRFSLPQLNGHVYVDAVRFEDFSLKRLAIVSSSEQGAGAIEAQMSLEGLAWKESVLPPGNLQAHISPSSIQLLGSLLGGELTLNSTLSLNPDQTIAATINLNDLNLGALAHIVQPSLKLTGQVKGSIDVNGSLTNIAKLNVQAQIPGLLVSSHDITCRAAEPIRVELQDNELRLDSFKITGNGVELSAQGKIPLTSSATTDPVNKSASLVASDSGNVNTTTDVSASEASELLQVKADIDVKTALPFAPVLDRLEGTVTANFNLAGALAQPSINGSLTIKDVALDGPDLPGPLEKLNGYLTITPQFAKIERFQGRFADGIIEVTGETQLQNFTPGKLTAALRARDLNIDFSPELNIRTSADIAVAGDLPKLAVTGEVRVAEALYSPTIDFLGILQSLSRPSVAVASGGEIEDEQPTEVSLDIAVIAPDSIRVENPNLELGLGAKLQIIGTTRVPGVLGSVTITEGMIDLYRSIFTITKGNIRFSDPWALNPDLDIAATTEKKNELITMTISGKANQPQLNLTSESNLTTAEIMKLLVGAPPSTGPSASLTDMAKEYATQGLATAIADALTEQTDLIVIPFPSTSEGEQFLFGAGKKVGEKITVMYYKAAKSENGNAVEVEMNLTPKTNAKLRQNPDGTLSGGFRFRKTFN